MFTFDLRTPPPFFCLVEIAEHDKTAFYTTANFLFNYFVFVALFDI